MLHLALQSGLHSARQSHSMRHLGLCPVRDFGVLNFALQRTSPCDSSMLYSVQRYQFVNQTHFERFVFRFLLIFRLSCLPPHVIKSLQVVYFGPWFMNSLIRKPRALQWTSIQTKKKRIKPLDMIDMSIKYSFCRQVKGEIFRKPKHTTSGLYDTHTHTNLAIEMLLCNKNDLRRRMGKKIEKVKSHEDPTVKEIEGEVYGPYNGDDQLQPVPIFPPPPHPRGWGRYHMSQPL